MRKLLSMACVPVLCLFVCSAKASGPKTTDTGKINHVLDGNINEWKADKFETDKETNILYAMDHDANNLYLAMKITDMPMQMKVMMRGMSLYIDKNGKKKERTGIEFPVKRDAGAAGFGGRRGGGGAGEEGGGRPDPKEMRERLAAGMVLLKTFGFDDQEEKTQLINQPGGANVAFDWDDANNFFIEYQVPLSLLGQPAALNGKTLGIGWKIFGMELPSSSSSSMAAPPGGSFGGRGGGGGTTNRTGGARAGGGNTSGGGNFGGMESQMKEQSFWTKYILNL